MAAQLRRQYPGHQVKFLASIGTILFVANGIFALILNKNAWTKSYSEESVRAHTTSQYGSPSPWVKDYSQESKRHRLIRKIATWTFLVLLLIAILVFGIPLLLTIYQLFV